MNRILRTTIITFVLLLIPVFQSVQAGGADMTDLIIYQIVRPLTKPDSSVDESGFVVDMYLFMEIYGLKWPLYRLPSKLSCASLGTESARYPPVQDRGQLL